jgi:hypothetical protein
VTTQPTRCPICDILPCSTPDACLQRRAFLRIHADKPAAPFFSAYLAGVAAEFARNEPKKITGPKWMEWRRAAEIMLIDLEARFPGMDSDRWCREIHGITNDPRNGPLTATADDKVVENWRATKAGIRAFERGGK